MSDISLDALVEGVLAADRAVMGQALTLVESTQASDRATARDLVDKLAPQSGGSLRIGVTGIPGAGKSTLIDALGSLLIEAGHKVAVLAVDPSSTKSGGSILGDKTRMGNILNDPQAFVRPSPTSGSVGGATRTARESISILEAAGYDMVFLETVGVGQSELAAVDMVDFFILVVIPGAGDELQGIKRGIVELADMVLVNKADSMNQTLVQSAVRDYTAALHLLHSSNLRPPDDKAGSVEDNRATNVTAMVLAVSALNKTGLPQVLNKMKEYHEGKSGHIQEIRKAQKVKWLWLLIENAIFEQIRNNPKAKDLTRLLESRVLDGEISPAQAAELFIEEFYKQIQ